MSVDDYLAIRWLGSENSTVDKFVQGTETTEWHVSGEDMEAENVMLLPNPTRFHDTPVTTIWQAGAARRHFQGFFYSDRDPQLGFQIFGGTNGDADDWRLTDSEFCMSWDYERLGRLEFETADGVRYLDLSLMSEPTSYQGQIEDGKSPFLRHDATVIINAAAPYPNFRGAPVVQEQDCVGSSGTLNFTVTNDGNTVTWLKWTVTSVAGGTRYGLPDYSFGRDEFSRAEEDAHRVWPSPELMEGEHTTFDSDPDEEFAHSNLWTNVWARCTGDLMYPIPPHTQVTLPVTYTGATAGDKVRLTYQCSYTRAWGVSKFKVVTP